MADKKKWPQAERDRHYGKSGGGGGGGGGKRTRSPETIAKQKATREANAAAKKARADATGRPLERGNRVQRTRNVVGNRGAQKQQVVRGTGSRTARIRRGVSGASVGGQSGGSTRSPRRTAPQTKKAQSSTEQRYRRMSSNLRKERREGRSGQFQAERLARFTGSRGRD